MQRTCQGCGLPFVPNLRERNPQVWCSVKCCARATSQRQSAKAKDERAEAPRTRIYLAECAVCDAPFVGRAPRANLCSVICRKMVNAQRMKARYGDAVFAQVQRARSADWRASRSPEQYVEDCRRATERVKATGYTESKRAGDARRRARKSNAPTVEKFTRTEVFERDAWRCGICRRKVDSKLAYPHPLSPSLDHIVPLSKGGEHTKANTRLAHLRCNVIRRDQGAPEQLALVG